MRVLGYMRTGGGEPVVACLGTELGKGRLWSGRRLAGLGGSWRGLGGSWRGLGEAGGSGRRLVGFITGEQNKIVKER